MSKSIRLGAVSYLNTIPLVYGLQGGLGRDRLELSYDVPAELTRRMLAGELDIALLPVVSLAVLPDLELVPGLGITTSGRSLSVLLLSRKPLDRVTSVALDGESNTSNALTRVLFADVWNASPVFAPGPADTEAALDEHDAVVRIGDKALFEATPSGVEAHDLGEVWTRSTGLPFVFAAWAARPGVIDRELHDTLHASKRAGSEALDRIAESFAWHGKNEPELVERYLRHHIHFRLGTIELRALRLFLDSSARLGLIESAPEIRLASFCGAGNREMETVLIEEKS